jgi:hypothetical protein
VIAADFGRQKFRVGVQIKSGAYIPDGTTTVGAELHIVETDRDGKVVNDVACTTSVTAGPGDDPTASFCSGDGGFYYADPGDTVTITQTSAPPNLLVATPADQTLTPCGSTTGLPTGLPCMSTVLFSDPVVPPKAADDRATVLTGTSVDVDVLANDTTLGAPNPELAIGAGPAHGTATVVESTTTPAAVRAAAATGAPFIRYTPDAGFVGTDSFHYTLTTANGKDTGTVTISVTAAPPTAVDDHARTTAGKPVTVDVTANDDAHGGGALTVGAVADPAHGSAAVRGGKVVYTPDAGFVGTDDFDYTVTTPYGSATATVSVQVSKAKTTPAPASPTPADHAPDSELANTGTVAADLVGLAGVLLLAGGAATVGGRHRRRRAH